MNNICISNYGAKYALLLNYLNIEIGTQKPL